MHSKVFSLVDKSQIATMETLEPPNDFQKKINSDGSEEDFYLVGSKIDELPRSLKDIAQAHTEYIRANAPDLTDPSWRDNSMVRYSNGSPSLYLDFHPASLYNLSVQADSGLVSMSYNLFVKMSEDGSEPLFLTYGMTKPGSFDRIKSVLAEYFQGKEQLYDNLMELIDQEGSNQILLIVEPNDTYSVAITKE